MRKALIVLVLAGAVAAAIIVTAALAKDRDGKNNFSATLNGFNEIVGAPGPGTGSVSTGAQGTFRARLRDNPQRLEFTLTYRGIEGGTVTQAHPHFAQRHVGGDVFGFLCGGPKPPCPSPSGTVQGTITPADIIGPAGQGVEPGAFAEFVRALRAGAVYVNVHSQQFPEGEIRGQVGRGEED